MSGRAIADASILVYAHDAMPRYRTQLVCGRKKPYDTWTFAVVPDDIRRALGGKARIDVRGTVAGAAFRSTISKAEGGYRFPVTRAVRESAGIGAGDVVDVVLDLDREPRSVDVPSELREILEAEGTWARFEDLSPSLRRAWAQYVDEAKKPETRARRARESCTGTKNRTFPRQK
jgi:hypothetical protein